MKSPLIALSVVLAVVGLGARVRQEHALVPVGSQSTSTALPQAPPPSPTPRTNPEQKSAAATQATAALACIQNALGGVQVFTGVSSLRIVGTTKPTAPATGFAPVANQREIGIRFPDRYKKSDVEKIPRGAVPLTGVTGFVGDEYLMNLRPPDAAIARRWELGIRREFAQQILMRLPRELRDVRLSQRTTLDTGRERLAVDAAGPNGLHATLLADPGTCMPVALEYRQPIGGTDGPTDAYHVQLSQYRRFGGILFPTMLQFAKNGEPWEDEHDSEIQVNPALDDNYFRSSGR